MSNRIIEKLLNGAEVEWKPLGDVAELKRGKVISKGYLEENKGVYPVYSSQTMNNGEIGKINSFDFDGEFLTWTTDGANAGTVFYRNGRFSITNVCGLIKAKEYLDHKFLFYWLSIEAKKYVYSGMGNPKLMSHQIERILIPIPPLEIQEKIVKTLDKFTELEATLEATLEAELALRKKQYQYYRETLLTFPQDLDRGGYNEIAKALYNNTPVVFKALGEVAEYSQTRIKFDCLNEENYVGVDNLLQNRMGKINSNYVPTSGNLTEYKENNILIGNIRPYLKKIWQANNCGGANGDVLVIRITDSHVNPKYLYQVLADDKFFSYNMQHAKGAKMPRGNKSAILQYQIPIPPIEEQNHIVEILDKFDRLTNFISEGLPKEIELRRKQYEYYREQLLDFPR